MPYIDPDEKLVAFFRLHAKKNTTKSLEAGRPIYEDEEVVEIHFPASREVSVFPGWAMSHWQIDPETGSQYPVTYRERFKRQYEQFKAKAAQTKVGTPLQEAPFISAGKRLELQGQNIYTVEQLASVEGAELKNLGIGGRDLKNAACEYIERGTNRASDMKLHAELEALRAKNAILEEDLAHAKAKPVIEDASEGEFAGMSNHEIKEYVANNTGQTPLGNPSRKTLVRMATECRPERMTAA